MTGDTASVRGNSRPRECESQLGNRGMEAGPRRRWRTGRRRHSLRKAQTIAFGSEDCAYIDAKLKVLGDQIKARQARARDRFRGARNPSACDANRPKRSVQSRWRSRSEECRGNRGSLNPKDSCRRWPRGAPRSEMHARRLCGGWQSKECCPVLRACR